MKTFIFTMRGSYKNITLDIHAGSAKEAIARVKEWFGPGVLFTMKEKSNVVAIPQRNLGENVQIA